MKCKDIISSLNDLIDAKAESLITVANDTSYDPLPNRTADCELGLVGKPVFYHAIESETFGAWLRDPVRIDNNTVEKVWLTKESDKKLLYEYRNKNEYQLITKSEGQSEKKFTSTRYRLPCDIEVSTHKRERENQFILHENYLFLMIG